MYIYKTTNRVNNKVYIGKSMKTFNENYLGSGILLQKAIKKYGKESFSVEVIDTAKTLDLPVVYFTKEGFANFFKLSAV